MNSERKRNGVLRMVSAIVGMMFLNGCVHTDARALEAFAADLLRAAASALLL